MRTQSTKESPAGFRQVRFDIVCEYRPGMDLKAGAELKMARGGGRTGAALSGSGVYELSVAG